VAEPLPPTVVSEHWAAALADAGITADDVAFWPCEGFALLTEPAPACTFPAVRGFDDERFEPALKRAGYDVDGEMRPRVALYTDFHDPEEDGSTSAVALLDGVMRHELHHVQQNAYWSARGFDLYELDGLLDWLIERTVRNPGLLYSCKPIEQDANAAASLYLWDLHDEEVLRRIYSGGRFAELVRYYQPPGEPETLVERMVAFCLLLPRAVAMWESIYLEPFGAALEREAPGSRALWQALQARRASGGEAA
jgi:hypothetical protein